MKTVRVTLELSPEFLRHLHTNQQMKKVTKTDGAPMTASDLVARMVYMEARGALPSQMMGEIPMEWRQGNCLEIIYDERRCYEGGKLISGPRTIKSE